MSRYDVRRHTLRRMLTQGAAAITVLSSAALAPAAYAADAPIVHIQAASLSTALLELARQTQTQIFFQSELVRGRTAPSLSGRLTAEEALRQLLEGSGLVYERSEANVLVVRAESDARGPRAGEWDAPASEASPPAEPNVLSEIVVTGSLIRGVKDGASPVTVIEREQIDRAGYATLAEAMRALPQNYAGVASEESFVLGTDRTARNASHASGVNLRGLGADATLVLVNGRRLAGVGASGDFADLSTLPTAAIARVEVLLDGASALYGSDAVGGVVNVILRDEFDGAENRLRIGQAQGGVAQEVLAAQTIGRSWSNGSFLASYEYYERDRLIVDDRTATATADLTGRGGTDWRRPYSTPGNILGLVGGGYRPLFAIPEGQDGTALTPASFLAGRTNLENFRAGADLLPKMERHSLYAVAHQELLKGVRLTVDGRWGVRNYDRTTEAPFAILSVNSSNPYFVSPTGATSHTIGYGFGRELGVSLASGEIKSLGLTAGLDVDLPRRWRLEGYVALAKEKADTHLREALNSQFLSEALGATPDNPATAFSTARDGFFNPFGSGASNNPTVLAFIGSGYSDSTYKSEVSSINLKADGPVFDLPGGKVRLAVGAQKRWEALKTVGATALLSLPRPTTGIDVDRDTTAYFAEANIPIFGIANARPGLQRLEISAAVRREDYSDAGVTTNPKVGVIWSPNAELTARASYGRSFRAPGLREAGDRTFIGQVFRNRGATQVLALQYTGGNPDLVPQTAEALTFGFDYKPAKIPDASFTLNAFEIVFKDRIGAPVSETPALALVDPALSPFVRLVSPATDAADLALINALLASPDYIQQAAFPADAYGAVIDARNVNSARIEVQGIDVSARYGFDQGQDRFDFDVEVSHVARYRRRITPAADWASLVDRIGYPVDWKGRVTGSWSRGSLGASLSANYVDNYAAETRREVDSWITFDAQLRYQAATGPLSGVSFALSARNLFNEAPPFYDNPVGVAYDPGQADVIGRHISIMLTKAW